MVKKRKYQDFLMKHLQDHDEAVAYLNAALKESLKGDGKESPTSFFDRSPQRCRSAGWRWCASQKSAPRTRKSLQDSFRQR